VKPVARGREGRRKNNEKWRSAIYLFDPIEAMAGLIGPNQNAFWRAQLGIDAKLRSRWAEISPAPTEQSRNNVRRGGLYALPQI
jgi:hypothetical protein